MNIACVTFYDPITGAGGGTTPAYAFSDWCGIIGHESEVLYDPPINILNMYDAVFFNTPPFDPDYDFAGITVPYALMIHVEGDLDIYPAFEHMVKHEMCKVLVDIDHDGHFFSKYHENNVQWHPCCKVKYLSSKVYANDAEKLLYAGRITPWKNAHLMKRLENAGLDCDYYGNISHKDYAYKYGIKTLKFDSNHNPIDYSKYDVFWSVCGSDTNKMIVKRMDLTAFEAFSQGCMPIVDPNTIPKELSGLFIEHDPKTQSTQELINEIGAYRADKDERWFNAVTKIMESYASIPNIRNKIEEIIGYIDVSI